MAINLKDPFLCCHAVVTDMPKAAWRRIVNISSSSAQTNYAATKAGVIGFTKSLAMKLAETGINLHKVVLGFVNTGGCRNRLSMSTISQDTH